MEIELEDRCPNSDILSKLKVPRLYQKELIEEAKKRNIIVRADTGSGKTLVALHLMKWVADQSKLKDRPSLQAFLVPTRPLVQQQAQLIEEGTNLRVKAYTGAQQPEFWKIEKWKDELKDVDVMVSTAQIFFDLISKGFWNFEDISLIVFDEAHHCRKSHVYNQIMQTHYHRLAKKTGKHLPKILGLTASPMWDFKNFAKAENDIQTLQSDLAAQLYEVKNVADLAKYASTPKERVYHFQIEPPDEAQNLQKPWDVLIPWLEENAGAKFAKDCTCVLEDLGPYARNIFVIEWMKSYLSPENTDKAARSKLLDPIYRNTIEGMILALQQTFDPDDVPIAQLSVKLQTLIEILCKYKETHGDKFSGIIFVARRQHALLLTTLISRIASIKTFIRPVALTGHGAKNESMGIDTGMGSREQNKSVEQFRKGKCNLTIATNVAEEGLDFRACNIVIRFDEINTWKGYVQSRGRARAINSDFVIMLPQGSSSKYAEFAAKKELVKSELYDRPEDEVIPDGKADLRPQLLCSHEDGKKAILTYTQATGLLNDVCQLIPNDEFAPLLRPHYVTSQSAEGFLTTVTLPPMASLPPSNRTFKGEPMPTKKESKRSAAFAACKILRDLDVLDEHFVPRREDNSRAPVDANGRKISPLKLPDQVKVNCLNPFGRITSSSEIWLHKLSLDYGDLGVAFVGFLCANQLLQPPCIELFDHHHGGKSILMSLEKSVKLQWSEDCFEANIAKLDCFTRMAIQAAVNRRSCEEELLFFITPLVGNKMEIDWELVKNSLIPISGSEDLSNHALIVAQVNTLSPRIFLSFESCPYTLESHPSEIPGGRLSTIFEKRLSKFKSLKHYFQVVCELQPKRVENSELIFVEPVFSSFDPFQPTKTKEKASPPGKMIIPLSVCKASKIPVRFWESISFLPAISRLLHDSCQVQTLFKELGVFGISTKFGIEALTQPGVGLPWDYQTLETVGDAFLKLATTVHVYLTHKHKCEGDMSLLRARSVDNAYLRQKSLKAKLGGFVLSQRYRTDKYKAAHLENGKVLEDGRFEREIPRRVLSDIVEALLGAALLSGGPTLALEIGTKLDLCFGGSAEWRERKLEYPFDLASVSSNECFFTERHEKLERRIGYVFKKKLWLIQALTHRSANSFLTNCYEREEWLGDAVIDMWTIDHVYKRFSDTTAEKLTLARARLVSNGSLGFLALRKLKLHELIHHQSRDFKVECERCLEELSTFSTIAEYYQDIKNVFVTFDPPKILNDTLEAVVGAVFVDSGFDLPSTYRTLDLIYSEVLPGLTQSDCRDPLSRLLRMRDSRHCKHLTRESKTASEPNPDPKEEGYISVRICVVKLHGKILGTGRHRNSASVAEQRAALEAIDALEESEESPGKSSEWKICNCKVPSNDCKDAFQTKEVDPGKQDDRVSTLFRPVKPLPQPINANNQKTVIDLTEEDPDEADYTNSESSKVILDLCRGEDSEDGVIEFKPAKIVVNLVEEDEQEKDFSDTDDVEVEGPRIRKYQK